jgi:hypothetical protein
MHSFKQLYFSLIVYHISVLSSFIFGVYILGGQSFPAYDDTLTRPPVELLLPHALLPEPMPSSDTFRNCRNPHAMACPTRPSPFPAPGYPHPRRYALPETPEWL